MSPILDHLLFCNQDPSFDDFAHHFGLETNKFFLLEIKESLLIKRDKLVLNKNISFAPLLLWFINMIG